MYISCHHMIIRGSTAYIATHCTYVYMGQTTLLFSRALMRGAVWRCEDTLAHIAEWLSGQEPGKLSRPGLFHARPACTPRVEVLREAAVSQLCVLDAADLILVLHGRGVRNGCGIDLMCLLRDMWACGHLYSLKSELLHINVHVLHCIGKVLRRCVVEEIYIQGNTGFELLNVLTVSME